MRNPRLRGRISQLGQPIEILAGNIVARLDL
jgi:hypothetical protein